MGWNVTKYICVVYWFLDNIAIKSNILALNSKFLGFFLWIGSGQDAPIAKRRAGWKFGAFQNLGALLRGSDLYHTFLYHNDMNYADLYHTDV